MAIANSVKIRTCNEDRAQTLIVVFCNLCNMKVIMDSDALIKVTKASVKDVIVSNIEVFVPEEVEREIVDEGKIKGYPDAIVVEDNIKKGKINAIDTKPNEVTEGVIKSLHLLGGEADSFRLFKQGKYDAITSDDQRFLDLIDSLGIPFTTPTSLLLYLWKAGKISKRKTRGYLEKMRELISLEEYLISIEELGR